MLLIRASCIADILHPGDSSAELEKDGGNLPSLERHRGTRPPPFPTSQIAVQRHLLLTASKARDRPAKKP